MGSLLRLLLTLSTLACIQRCKGSNGTDVEVQWWDAPARRWHTVPCHADTEAVMGQEGLSRRMVPDAGGGCGWFDVPGVATTTTPGRMFRTFVTSGRRLDVRARDLSASHATKYTLIVKSGVPPSTRHGSKDHDLRLEDVNPAFVQKTGCSSFWLYFHISASKAKSGGKVALALEQFTCAVRDYSARCPVGWEPLGDHGWCRAPEEYAGPCSPMLMGRDRRLHFAGEAMDVWEVRCQAPWPCKTEIQAVPCPLVLAVMLQESSEWKHVLCKAGQHCASFSVPPTRGSDRDQPFRLMSAIVPPLTTFLVTIEDTYESMALLRGGGGASVPLVVAQRSDVDDDNMGGGAPLLVFSEKEWDDIQTGRRVDLALRNADCERKRRFYVEDCRVGGQVHRPALK
eukprot:jgi/Mesvir1/7947/Mv11867-RA.2